MSRFSSLLALLFSIAALLPNPLACADPTPLIPIGGPQSPVSFTNVSDALDADILAKELIDRYQNADGTLGKSKDNPILILHLGDELPPALEPILVQLKNAHLFFEIKQVNQSEIEAAIDESARRAPETARLLTYGSPSREARGGDADPGRFERAKLWARGFFGVYPSREPRARGLPLARHSLVYWQDVPRSSEIRASDRARAIKSAAIAAASIAGTSVITSFLDPHLPLTMKIVPASVNLGLWVYVNMNWFRSIHEVMSQGKTLAKKTAPNGQVTWEVQASKSFFWPSNFARSVVSNAIIMASLDGAGAFSGSPLERNLENSFINMFARSNIDKYIADKTPTTKDENGDILVKEGQWSPEAAGRINFWWQTLYPFLKNFQLMGVGTPVFVAMMGVNLAWPVFQPLVEPAPPTEALPEADLRSELTRRFAGVRTAFKDTFTQIMGNLRDRQTLDARACETLLTSRQALGQ